MLTRILCQRNESVSYTHLDVYKRQAIEGVSGSEEIVVESSRYVEDGSRVKKEEQ